MNLKPKQLSADDRAVSPVIGVILMVAITVILAAVIGTFVLGLGSGLNQTPTATIDVSYDADADSPLTVTHTGGDVLTGSEVTVVVGGESNEASDWEGDDGQISAGESVSLSASAGDTVQVVWQSGDGSSSSVIEEFSVPGTATTSGA